MKLKLVVRRIAENEMEEAVAWYHEISPELAGRFARAVDLAYQRILSNPQRHGFGHFGTRHCQLKSFPYQIHYLVEATSVVIMAVFNTHRDPESLRTRH